MRSRRAASPNFYTPEHAVEAFSFLAAYRHHQEWLLEVPPSQPEPQPPDLAAVERIRAGAASANRRALTEMEVHTLLSVFGLPVAPAVSADSPRRSAGSWRGDCGFPVTLRSDTDESVPCLPVPVVRERLRDGRMLTRAWATLVGAPGSPHRRLPVIVAKERDVRRRRERRDRNLHRRGVRAGDHVRPGVPPAALRDVVALCRRSICASRATRFAARACWRPCGRRRGRRGADPLARVLVQLSALACALPWVRTLTLDPVRVGDGRAEIVGARITIDPRAKSTARSYGHMAIHPYPVEMVADVALADGRHLHVRPIRPEDAEMERAFVNGLSEETRFFRFFYRLHELTPAMLARFTQIDYDREVALVAVDEAGAVPAIVGVARYVMSLDQESAEFAVVVADAWHGRGVARNLMARLVTYAKARGLRRLEGRVLRSNRNMLAFIAALGFKSRESAEDPEQLSVVLELQ